MVATHNCQLDEIYYLGMYLRDYLYEINGDGKHTHCGWQHSQCWGPGLHDKEKASWTKLFIAFWMNMGEIRPAASIPGVGTLQLWQTIILHCESKLYFSSKSPLLESPRVLGIQWKKMLAIRYYPCQSLNYIT